MIDVMSKTVFCVCIKDSVLYTWKQTFEQWVFKAGSEKVHQVKLFATEVQKLN
jgi:hypothetical protein